MTVPFWEILNRSKSGPIVEEKQYDLALFKKTQELQKKYGIKYDPAKPVDVEGEHGRPDLCSGDGTLSRPRDLLYDDQTGDQGFRRRIEGRDPSRPEAVEMGQGRDRVKMVHREVGGPQEPIVIAGIQTIPFSDEEMMFKISRGCAMDRCVDGIWGGILLKIDGRYDVVAGSPSEIYQYRKTVGDPATGHRCSRTARYDHLQQCSHQHRHDCHVR